MAELIATNICLSDSLCKSRPSFKRILTADDNSKNLVVSNTNEQQRLLNSSDRNNTYRFRKSSETSSPVNEVVRQSNSKLNISSNSRFGLIDPVTSFVGAGGDVIKNTGHKSIPSLVQLSISPQSQIPQAKISSGIGFFDDAPGIQRISAEYAGAANRWNSRKVLDCSIRSKLGESFMIERSKTLPVMSHNRKDEKLKLNEEAKRYVYGASTQRSYSDIPWDDMLLPKPRPAQTTLETQADCVSQRFEAKRYASAPEKWQNLGGNWDWFQTRNTFYKDNPLDIAFCSTSKRTQQIPGYSGCIGAKQLVEIDNINESFVPLTVKRSEIPRPTRTAHQPHIPGFSGCKLYASSRYPDIITGTSMDRNSTAHSSYLNHDGSPYSLVNRHQNVMCKMTTTVPPFNPFNKYSASVAVKAQ